MIDNSVKLANGMNFEQYHQNHFQGMTGFPSYHNTNIDKVCRFLDVWPFKTCKDYEEQDKAKDINYAHGLELDDMFGDPYGVDRNGLDDIEYRFVLKCHRLAINCNGTLPELINFISTSLDCSNNDVELGMARHYIKGKLTGEPDTILIKNINIENVPHDQLIPLLSNELQLAVSADKRVDQVDFYTNINNNEFVGTDIQMHATINIPIPNTIKENMTQQFHSHVGASVVMRGDLNLE